MSDLFKCDAHLGVENGKSIKIYAYSENAEGKRIQRIADLCFTCFTSLKIVGAEGKTTSIQWTEKEVKKRYV